MCGSIFHNKSNLNRHVKNICATTNTTLTDEEDNISNVNSKFFCMYCKSTFTRMDNLERHFKSRCKIKMSLDSQKDINNMQFC